MVKENLQIVQDNIHDACKRAGRNDEDCTLIAVSKTKPIPMIMEAYEAGVRDFGENKVQELMEKEEKFHKDVRWHLIGKLQTNKVKQIIDKVSLIHGVDSYHLGEEISKQAIKHQMTAHILVEVNIGGEESKFGCSPEDTLELARKLSELPGICVDGLMTIAPYVVNPEENRPCFVKMKQLAVDITQKTDNNIPKDIGSMKSLSMGMTSDYQVAVEEGATYVRVGTGIFGERQIKI